MKRYKFIITLFLLLTISFSCTDMLDQKDETAKDPDLYPENETELMSVLAAAYAGLTAGNSGEGFYSGEGLLLIEMLGDNLYRTGNEFDGNVGYIGGLLYTTEDIGIFNTYRFLYIGVARANQLIAAAQRGFPLSGGETERNQIIAEGRFLRALNYFHLTLLWGNVPLQLEDDLSDTDALLNNPSVPASEIYGQIIADLEFGIENLPDTPEQRGRADIWAAKALLSKVYLFGADEMGETSWFGLAESLAADVVNNSPYNLVDDPNRDTHGDYLELFDATTNDNEEVIFAVQHYNKGGNWANGDTGGRYPLFILPRYIGQGTHSWGFGWGYLYESANIRWSNEDGRKDFSVFLTGDSIHFENRDAQDLIMDSITTFNNEVEALHAGRIVRPYGAGVQKFWWTEAPLRNVNANSDFNFPVIRFADMLLIHAEADLMADGTLSSAGLENINRVRRRADLGDLSSATRDDILAERRWELFAEGHRWYDLLRTRTAEEAFALLMSDDTNGDDRDKANFSAARHYKLPYPLEATIANQGLEQKPEW